jgi:hypothetical protein
LHGHIGVKAVFDPVDGHELGGAALVTVELDKLDRREPVEAAGEPRDLSVMAKRGVDESGRTKERAHIPAL